MKKFFAILLSAMLMLSLAVPAMAVDATQAVVNNTTDHTYNAYQIFAATNQVSAGGALGNITWGEGINHTAFLAELKTDTRFNKTVNDVTKNIFEGCEDAQNVAEVLAANVDVAEDFADLAAAHVVASKAVAVPAAEDITLELGYWLLLDTTAVGTGDAKNAALLQVVKNGDLTIQQKYDVPTIEKTVNDSDVNIGDTVTFTLTAKMPSRLDGYDSYKIVFHDTMSKGLTFGSITSVTVGASTTDVKNQFTLDPTTPTADADTGETTFTLTCDDVLASAVGAKAKDEIVVTYTAIIDSDAVIGTEGNPNKVYLEYSNDPTGNGTGNTTEKEVKVYTWEIPVFKYTGTDTPLSGAGFTLYKDQACTQAVKVTKDTAVTDKNIYKVDPNGAITEIVTDNTGKFEIEGLEQGTYYLKETTTPAGYNTCNNVTVVIGKDGALTQNGSATTEVAIQNNSGSVLPETGGIGTTIFYIVGGLLAVGAAVLLITKKRMSTEG